MRFEKLGKSFLWTVAGLFLGLCAMDAYGQIGAPHPSSEIRIPFEVQDGHVFVTATLNGKPVRAVLDTGAPISFLDTSYARNGGLPLKAAKGSVNDQSVQRIPRMSYELSLGGQKIDALVATDLKDVNGAPMVVGIRDVFSHRVVELNFQSRQMVLHRAKTFVAPAGVREVRLVAKGRGSDRHYGLPILINGGAPILAEVDLGNNGGFDVSHLAAAKAGLTRIPDAKRVVVTVGAPTVEEGMAMADVEFAGYRFPKAVISIAGPDERHTFDNFDANIGVMALSSFRLWIDVSSERMWIQHKPHYVIGIDAPSGEVRTIKPGLPADRAGIKTGDRILTVNGQPMREFWDKRDKTSPAAWTLRMADGRVLTVQPINAAK